MENYINTIVTSNKTTNETTEYQIQSFDTLDKNNIIDAAYNEVVNKALPQLKADLQDAPKDLVVSEYLSENTKEASLTIGNNYTSLKNLQSKIKETNVKIDKSTEELGNIKNKVNYISTPIDECPTKDPGGFSIEAGVKTNISSIKLTEQQLIPNRMYGEQSIYKTTCEILVDKDKNTLFDDNKDCENGVEIIISLPPIQGNKALLPLQLGGIWQSTSSNSKTQSFDPFPMFTRQGELMAICFQQSNQLIIKVFQTGMTYSCNRLFFSLEYVLINANQTEGDETTQ